MADRIELMLLVGPAVPLPAPRPVMEALVSAKVTAADDLTAFELRFKLSVDSPLHTLFLASGGASIPLMRVVLLVLHRGLPTVLADGVMTHHQVSGGEAGQAELTVFGEDLSRVMDYLTMTGMPYPGMPPEARVAAMLAKYGVLGIVPAVVPTPLPDVPPPNQRIPLQVGTDLEYIRELAEEAGYVFYVEAGPVPGTSVAYWGPSVRVGLPQPALNVDLDGHTNVTSMAFSASTEQAVLPLLVIQEEASAVPIVVPVPDVSLLRPPLGLVPPIPKRIEPIVGTGRMSLARAALMGLSRAAGTSDCFTASGSLDVLRYGHVLRPRGLVGVRGAGAAFDGLWYVKGVTSELKAGSFTQQFELVRNGLVSTVPVVRP